MSNPSTRYPNPAGPYLRRYLNVAAGLIAASLACFIAAPFLASAEGWLLATAVGVVPAAGFGGLATWCLLCWLNLARAYPYLTAEDADGSDPDETATSTTPETATSTMITVG